MPSRRLERGSGPARKLVRTVLVVVATLAVSAPAPAAAQDPGENATFEARVPAEILQDIRALMEGARADSLPVSALQAKILEGVAKGVEPGLIRTAATRLADEYRGTRRTLRAALPGRPLHPGEVSAATMAMRQGVEASDLAALWDAGASAGSLEIPLAVVGELRRRGIEAGQAVEAMGRVLRGNGNLALATRLPGRMDAMMPGAAAPGAALSDALRSLGLPAGPPDNPGAPGRRPPGAGPPGGGPPGGPPGGGPGQNGPPGGSG